MPHSSPDLALQMETEDLMTKAHPGCLLSLSVSHARTAGHVCGSLAALATGDCRGFQVVSLKGPILGLPHHKCFCLILRGLLSPGEFYFPLCCQDPDFGILAPNSPSNTAPTILCNDQHS